MYFTSPFLTIVKYRCELRRGQFMRQTKARPEKLRSLKQAMTQDLLTGRTRLVALNEAVIQA